MNRCVVFGELIDSELPLLQQAQRDIRQFSDDRVIILRETNEDPRQTAEFAQTGPELLRHERETRLLARRAANGELAYCYEVGESLLFHFSTQSDHIAFHRTQDVPDSTARFWFLHTILPMFLAARYERKLLHAGAVGIEDAVAIFLAPSQGGKSTLTHFFCERGHSLYSDDILSVSIEQAIALAQPSHGHTRPHRQPESLGEPAPVQTLLPGRIERIFNLLPAAAGDEVKLSTLSGAIRLSRLLPAVAFEPESRRTDRFRFYSRFAALVPVIDLHVPWALSRLPEVYDAVLAHRAEGS